MDRGEFVGAAYFPAVYFALDDDAVNQCHGVKDVYAGLKHFPKADDVFAMAVWVRTSDAAGSLLHLGKEMPTTTTSTTTTTTTNTTTTTSTTLTFFLEMHYEAAQQPGCWWDVDYCPLGREQQAGLSADRIRFRPVSQSVLRSPCPHSVFNQDKNSCQRSESGPHCP